MIFYTYLRSLLISSTTLPPHPPPPVPTPSTNDGLHVDFDINFGLGRAPYDSSSVLTDGISTAAHTMHTIRPDKPTSHRQQCTPSPSTHSQRQQSIQLHHPFQPLLILENLGSVARDHLASERTFLAYVRTSLAIASTGVALMQLFTLSAASPSASARSVRSIARPLGATTVAFALCVLCAGFMRYFSIQSALTRGLFPVARWTVAGIALVLGALVSIAFALSLQAR